MSEQTIQKRAATIRRDWSRKEQMQRAVASDQRCLNLLLRLTVGAGQGAAWGSRRPA
jgi:hypothetical protein